MTKKELLKIAEDYLNSTLQHCEEARSTDAILASEDMREGTLMAYSDQFDSYSEALSDLDVRETRGRGFKLAEKLVTDVMQERDLSFLKDSEEYAYLTRELLIKAMEVCRIESERIGGNYSNEYDRSRLHHHGRQVHQDSLVLPAGPLLSEVITAYSQDHITLQKWTLKTEQENTSILAAFLELAGDQDITTITHQGLMQVRADLVKLPPNPKKGKEKEGKTLRDIIAMGLPAMSQSTASKYLIRIASFFKWAHLHKYVSSNEAEGLTLGKKKGRARDDRSLYDQEDIQRLYQSLEFDPAKPERFYIPLVAQYSGMRLDEICQLHLQDVRDNDGIPCFHVNDEGLKKVKTVAGIRIVPVHPVLIELGFLEYVKSLQARGAVQLWPNLKKKRDGYSQDFGKWYQRFNRREITQHPKRVFHSFRHGAIDALKQAGIAETTVQELMGQENANVTFGRYGKSFKPTVLLEVLNKVEFDVDLDVLRRKVPKILI